MNLFALGQWKLHSGYWSLMKIDCDALTDVDLDAIAFCIAGLLLPFGEVCSVPTGGDRLAEKLELHCTPEVDRLLIVDDVLTTGGSIIDVYREVVDGWDDVIGAVIFARGVCPTWVTPLFQLNPELQEKLTLAST